MSELDQASAPDPTAPPAPSAAAAGTSGLADMVGSKTAADHGLSTLGLLMQLGGSLFAAYACLALLPVMLMPMRGSGGNKGYLLVILGLCVGRSLLQRMAGTELLYGKPSAMEGYRPTAGLHRYILGSVIQTALLVAVFVTQLKVPTKTALAIAAGLLVWPVLLGVLFRLPRFKRYTTMSALPMGEDKGFEGAAIIMTVLGLCGVLGTGGVLLLLLDKGGALLNQGPGMLLLAGLGMLFVRSIFHVQAGLSGVRETNLDRSVELANRYANFGVIASFCAGAALLVVSMMGRANIGIMVVVVGVCWILMAWPLIIRRFFSERQFADLMAGDDAAPHQRAADAGVSSLGWLLLGIAVIGFSMLLPQLLIGDAVQKNQLMQAASLMGPLSSKSPWWSAGMLGFQAWAGYELIRNSSHSRVIASAYAVVCGSLTVWMLYPILKQVSVLIAPGSAAMFLPLAINLVVPIATLLLVNRTVTPHARARFVRPVGPSA
jgi:hypothetical protein